MNELLHKNYASNKSGVYFDFVSFSFKPAFTSGNELAGTR